MIGLSIGINHDPGIECAQASVAAFDERIDLDERRITGDTHPEKPLCNLFIGGVIFRFVAEPAEAVAQGGRVGTA